MTNRFGLRVGIACLLAATMLSATAADGGTATGTAFDALWDAAEHGDTHPLEVALPRLSDPVEQALAREKIAATTNDRTGVSRALASLRAQGALDAKQRARQWSVAADVAFSEGRYREAADAARRLIACLDPTTDGNARNDASQLLQIADVLSPQPAQRRVAAKPVVVRTQRDQADLLRADVRIDGRPVDAVLDTGANLSTISASMAAHLHLRMLDGRGSVGAGARDAVEVRVAIAPSLVIAGVRLANVAFLFLDDAALALPVPGLRIDVIVGFPVFRDLGRIRFGQDGTFAAMSSRPAGMRPSDPQPSNLRLNGNSLFVAVTVDVIETALHLDTGASTSSLSSIFVAEHPDILDGLVRRVVGKAGAGGATTQDTADWRDVAIDIAGRHVVLPSLMVETSASGDVTTRAYGDIGQDVLARFGAFTIDFGAMRFALDDPVAPAS